MFTDISIGQWFTKAEDGKDEVEVTEFELELSCPWVIISRSYVLGRDSDVDDQSESRLLCTVQKRLERGDLVIRSYEIVGGGILHLDWGFGYHFWALPTNYDSVFHWAVLCNRSNARVYCEGPRCAKVRSKPPPQRA